MKQQGLAIAAAAMLSLCLGIATAGSEQTGMDQTSACDSTQNVCLNSEMRDQDQLSQSDAEVGLRVGLQDESMTETESSDESQAEDQDNDADEQALDESQSRPVIIIVQ